MEWVEDPVLLPDLRWKERGCSVGKARGSWAPPSQLEPKRNLRLRYVPTVGKVPLTPSGPAPSAVAVTTGGRTGALTDPLSFFQHDKGSNSYKIGDNYGSHFVHYSSILQHNVSAHLTFPICSLLNVAEPIFMPLIQGAEPSCGGPTSDDIRPGAKPHITDTKNGMPLRYHSLDFHVLENRLSIDHQLVQIPWRLGLL